MSSSHLAAGRDDGQCAGRDDHGPGRPAPRFQAGRSLLPQVSHFALLQASHFTLPWVVLFVVAVGGSFRVALGVDFALLSAVRLRVVVGR
jgi:hypothetical protein